MNYKNTLLTLGLALTLGACSSVHSRLSSVHTEGFRRYIPDLGATSSTVEKAFQILPPGSLASCSHEVAHRVEMIRKRYPTLTPEVLIYDTPPMVNNIPSAHTVAVVRNKNEYIILDNQSSGLIYRKDLSMYKNPKLITLELARIVYSNGKRNSK